MNFLKNITLLVFLALPLSEALSAETAALEARLKESAEASPPAAELMLKLIEIYKADGQVFGLIRTASKFSRAQTTHPRRAEVMLDLIRGYEAAARHDDVITTARQFFAIFPDEHPLGNDVRHSFATAFERTGQSYTAAELRAAIWQNGGTIEQGIHALRIWMTADKSETYANAAKLALAMVEKIPADSVLTGIGFQGMDAALRSEKWNEGLQIAKTIARRNAPLDASDSKRLAFLEGRFEQQLGQFGNAVASFKSSLNSTHDDRHRHLVDAMIAAKSPLAEIEAEAKRYAAAFPTRDDRYDPLARTAHAAAAANDLATARRIAVDVMKIDASLRDLPRAFVSWCGDDHAQAVRGLKSALASEPKNAGILTAILALDVYRDRLKDDAKARATALDFLRDSPTGDGWTEEIVKFLYQSAPNQETFVSHLDAVADSARRFPHLAAFQARVWTQEPADKDHHREWLKAKRTFQSDATTKLWSQTREDGGKSGQACKELLGKKWSAEIRHHLLSRLAYVYRHHLGGKSKEVSAQHYRTLCKEFPEDLEAATAWLEAATLADQPMRLEAASHLLGITPAAVHHDNWLRLCETKDESIIRKALPWITASANQSRYPLTFSARIGDIMFELGMEKEALDWWRSRMEINPRDREAILCALRVARGMEPGAALAFLTDRYQSVDEFQGIYAAEIASLHFKQQNLDAMEKILADSRKRALAHPFKDWAFGEWPARGWLETARNSTEMTDDKKSAIYRMIRDLRLARLSAEAGMILLADAPRDLDRLLRTQNLILLCDPHHESWRRLYPFAQAALARKDPALAAAILNGLLNSIRSVGADQMADARTLLRKAYGEMGGISLDIPADSAIAPLLQIVLHLRLGETDLAEEAYYANQELFDKNRADLPVELLLFAAETHIAQGTPDDHQRAEDILRGWLMKFSEAENIDARDKARIQLTLARNYQRASQFDIARAEFTTVLNIHKDQPEAIDARFGIGETYMAQKIYDQAGEIFTDLAENPIPAVSIRANFLLGVLALRQENNDDARRIFLSVLENSPDVELANETLYNLAEVYGIEQRFLSQLETLRTVGRLGQESKLWQTPGNALPIVVQDPDLGISRGDTRIPVVVRTEPGGDEEKSFLTSGGAGKGIFLTEIPTILGIANPGDGVLQVTGGDTISVDYPEDFKSQFQFEFLANTRLRIASDGSLSVASSEIIDRESTTFTDQLKDEVKEDAEELPRSATRPADQIKPGNLIYAQVVDGDRDLTAEPDTVSIRLTASSGDEVLIDLDEQSAHGGVFRGTIQTGELPAGAGASDSALDHSPLMAIDQDRASAWRSEPDGAAPKSLSIDMKELREVESIVLTSPDPENESPVRMRVRGSHDGRFWFDLASFPPAEAVEAIAFPEKEFHLRRYPIATETLRETYTWAEITEIAKKSEPAEKAKVESLSWSLPEESKEANFLIWSGDIVQERDAAMRFAVSGRTTAVMLNGKLELAPGPGGRHVDIFVKRGIHRLTVFSIATPQEPTAEVLRARENPNLSAVTLKPFTAADFDLAAISGLERAPDTELLAIEKIENTWRLTMPPRHLRHIEYEFLEYRGESIAVSNVEVSGGENVHIPPAQDVLELAKNDTLELAPGDTVQISYLDELTAGGIRPNRLLSQSLTATYHNGQITPISFDFARTASGSVSGSRKELLRIEPGDRIVAEITDFDMDVSTERDTFNIDVQISGQPPVTYLATETGSSTGIFHAEIDTAAAPDGTKLVVAPRDKIFLRYTDLQNTFPGHASPREAVVYVNSPTDARFHILASESPVDGNPRILSATDPPAEEIKVEFRLPLTVEVLDPDQALDSQSSVTVEITTTQGTKAEVVCKLSRAYATSDESLEESRNPALLEGRFVGQIPLVLGTGEIAEILPTPENGSIIGAVVGQSPATPGRTLVLNTLGTDRITAKYIDQSRSETLESSATLASAATLRITDSEYAAPAEIARVGTKLFIALDDPDLDISPKRDKALVRILTTSGEDETVELEETLTHSGLFTASFPLAAVAKPTPGNFDGTIETFFGDEITVGYLDNVPQTEDGLNLIEVSIPVAVGTDGELAAFSKVFKDEELAIQTRFHIAESHFELFKGHRKLEKAEEAAAELEAGRRVLRELQEDYPNPKYAPRVSYLLGQFAQEMKAWDEAIAAYLAIVRNHPESPLAPDSQYKLGQCYEEAGELDEALEAYVTLAATYPNNPLVANVMLRINEHFYVKEEFAVAASVGEKFVERFPNHEWAPKMAFRIGQCHFKQEAHDKAGFAFDAFVKRFPENELTAQALFWAGESYRNANNIPEAFRRYNRCRWDFPESDAAKYSRGRLALPELLAQFEREANLE